MKTGTPLKVDTRLAASLQAKRQELEGLDFIGVVPWRPSRTGPVTRFITEKTGSDVFMTSLLPKYLPNQPLGKRTIKVRDIRWSQSQAANMSQDGKYTVVDNARALKAGTLNLNVLPVIRVWQDTQGRVWTLDHRRLAAIRMSGAFDEIPVEFVEESMVVAQKFKYSTRNEGNTILVHLDEKGSDGKMAIVVD